MLSIIIPSYKDPYLPKTIKSLLENAEGEIEIIAVLDGYYPLVESIVDDQRVRYLHLGKNRGMREAINTGVKASSGEFIMRTDEHCDFAPGYDVELTNSCKEDWIITAKRYYLDPITWTRLDKEPVVYEKLVTQSIGDKKKFTGFPTESPYKEPIHETQAMQGSMWVMPKKWWEKVIVNLDSERYGTHIQDSHEMVFKTWKAGGKLMVNENTWFAHKHVSFPRTHSYPSDQAEATAVKMYDDWIDYYQELKKQWS
jgi:glycosyltransferase involved in cell wall biosynthesis